MNVARNDLGVRALALAAYHMGPMRSDIDPRDRCSGQGCSGLLRSWSNFEHCISMLLDARIHIVAIGCFGKKGFCLLEGLK